MAKFIKIILSLVAFLVMVIIIAAVALPLYIDPNDFKPEIESAVNDATGRKLVIEGDLELSVFPWLGVSTGKLVLDNAPGFTETKFAEIEASEIKVKLLPLLSKNLEVNRIVLKGLRLNLAKNKSGVSNWDDLTKTEAKSAKQDQTSADAADKASKPNKEEAPLFAALAIGGIALEDAFIVWDDRQNDQHIELQKLNLKTDSLKFDEPIAIDLSVTIINAKPAVTERLELSTELTVNEALNVFAINDFKITSVTEAETLPNGKINTAISANIDIDLVKQTAKIPDLKLSINDLTLTANLTGNNILDKPQISGPIKIAEFNLSELLEKLKVDLPAMRNPGSLNALSVQFNLASTDSSAKLEQLQIKLDASTIKGYIDIADFKTQAIAFKFDLDSINIDDYLPTKTSANNKSSTQKVTKSRPVAPPPVAAAATLFLVKTLRGLNVSGQLTIGQMIISGLTMQGIVVNLKADKGLIETTQAVKQLYQGNYSGSIQINARNKTPVLSVDEKITNVQIGSLLKDLKGDDSISGIVNASAKIKSRGNTVKALKSTMNGTLKASVKDGYIKGFDLQKILDSSQSLLQSQVLSANSETDKSKFSEVSASAKITNGVINNNDLIARSSALRVNGKGSANLVTEALDYNIIAKLIRREATATKSEKIEGIPIAIDVGGTFSKPTYMIDIKSMLLEKNKAEIEEKAQEYINKGAEKIGGELGEQLGKDVGDLFKKLF